MIATYLIFGPNPCPDSSCVLEHINRRLNVYHICAFSTLSSQGTSERHVKQISEFQYCTTLGAVGYVNIAIKKSIELY